MINEQLAVVPMAYLQELSAQLKEIRSAMEKLPLNQNALPRLDYIDEETAKELLGRKTTWFWKQRTEGKLAFSKVGNKIFYRLKDIEAMIESNMEEKF